MNNLLRVQINNFWLTDEWYHTLKICNDHLAFCMIIGPMLEGIQQMINCRQMIIEMLIENFWIQKLLPSPRDVFFHEEHLPRLIFKLSYNIVHFQGF